MVMMTMMQVLDQAPTGLSYEGSDSATLDLYLNTAFHTIPTLTTGKSNTKFTINPTSLPTGLSFDSTTGEISGTTTEVWKVG